MLLDLGHHLHMTWYSGYGTIWHGIVWCAMVCCNGYDMWYCWVGRPSGAGTAFEQQKESFLCFQSIFHSRRMLGMCRHTISCHARWDRVESSCHKAAFQYFWTFDHVCWHLADMPTMCFEAAKTFLRVIKMLSGLKLLLKGGKSKT